MKSYQTLPEGYEKIYSVDLGKNKKVALFINALAVFIGAAMALIAHFAVCPVGTLFEMDGGIGNYLIRFGALALGSVLYIILHEATHGVAMKISGTKNVKYGFTGLYAFAGSDDYYTRGAYIFIALAPVVLFGIIFGIAAAFLDGAWFWVVYILQITNISGASGDAFVTVRFLMMPKDILVRDSGVGMVVYSKKAN